MMIQGLYGAPIHLSSKCRDIIIVTALHSPVNIIGALSTYYEGRNLLHLGRER